ncbi:MAG: autotransporter domain-containing protein [Candidatus Omnitrophota bacterium]|jgi:T5SS/PEP-CTERM-associated repeat protein/autotransporter-associated beta strand protein
MRTHKRISNLVKALCLFLGFSTIFSLSVASVYAGSFTVTNYSSSGDGSFSDAIDDLNTSAESGTITFNESSASGTIDMSGYTTSLGFETVFNLASYDVTLTNYVGGCTSWTKFDGATTGVLNIGTGSDWTNTWGLVVGESGTGALTVSGGGDLAVSNGGVYIASNADSAGALTVTGSGSTLGNASNLYVGNSGTGTLTVSDGGSMTNTLDVYIGSSSGSMGTVTVAGSGSTLAGRDLYIGSDGNFSLTVSGGGSLSGSFVALGYHSTSSGTAVVTGEGSLFAASSGMYIGYDGDCTMTVSDGADVTTDEGYIGSNSGSDSSLTVTGAGSTFASNNSLYVGCWDTGALDISDGAGVSNTAGVVGRGGAATGTVDISGSGSTWTNSTALTIGEDGIGTVTISDGAAVNVAGGAGTVRVGRNGGSTGTLNIGDGGTAGTLSAAEVNGGSGTATLKFNHTDEDYDFGLNLTGGLKVESNNTGITNFDGTNTYSGGTTINAGAIDAKVDDALGTGTVDINDGGSLLLGTVDDDTGSMELPNSINVEGDGNAGIGAINNAGGNNTISGAISTTADTTIGAVTGTLAINGGISSTSDYDLTFTGPKHIEICVNSAIAIGSGSVIKEGRGSLRFSGVNTYTGSTIINEGGLSVTTADALGSSSGVTIADNATLVLDEDGVDVSIDNDIVSVQGIGASGVGAIISVGPNNTISGSITQVGATTIYSNDGNLTLSGAIGGAYGLTLDGAGDFDISGAVTTITGLAKDGAGTLTLSGANTYTGATAVNAGAVNAGIADQAFGAGSDVTVAEGATLSLNNFNETIGSLSGSGTVNNGGAADRTLTIGSIPLGYGDTSVAFSGLIADGGAGKFALTKDGTGTLVLSGANTYSGATIIDGGTLQVSNARALGTGAVTNNATLDIGSTTLNVDGVYTQAAGSTLNLSAASASSLGSIVSPSDAVVSSASAVNVAVSGYLPNRATLKVIDGAGGAGVEVPATITSSSSKYRLVGSSLGGDLILTVDRSGPGMGFVSDANNGNAAAVASVLDNIEAPSGNMLLVLDTLENMTPGGVGRSLDTMSPVVDGGIISVSNNSLSQFVGTSTARLEGLFAQARDAEETGVSAGGETLKGFSVWGRGFGEYIRQEPRGISNGYRATVWGTALGGDIPVHNDSVRLGLSGGYAQSGINSKDNSGKTDIDSYQGTLYAGYLDGQNPYYLNGAFSFAYNEYKGSRHVAAGAIMRTADADYDGQQYSVLLDGGYTFKAGEFRMTPVASLQYTRLHLEGYTETGADALNLAVKGENYDMLQSGLGMKLERTFETETGAIIPEIHARWLYDFIGDRQETTSVFSGGGGSFATQGFDPAKNSLNAGAKLTLATRNDWSIETNYDFEYKEDFTSHTGWADIKYRF